MKYTQINPELNTQVLQKSGFVFDGYYYVNENCPIQLRKVDGGYSPSFKDPSGPKIDKNVVIKDYSNLISVMLSVLPIHLGKMMQKYAKFNDGEAKVQEELRKYWQFDNDISFTIIANPKGMQSIPQNEYTFSLVNGGILAFHVRYQEVKHDENGNKIDCEEQELILEANPQCICYNYVAYILSSELHINDFKVIYISFEEPENKILIPFFGTGIPRIERR